MALVLHRDSASGKNDGDKGSALAIYQPLTADDGFRLLELLPGSGNDPICCLLKHAVLSDAPEFEAMSYAWGDASDTLEIECEGVSFMVTRNLHALLSNIRHEDTARTLWVDAICIDQTNLAERSSQVQIMDRIYSTATLVLAWLGEAADGSDEAIEMIHTWRPLKWKSQPDRKLPVVTDPIWKKLHKLFHREYFRRMWIIQEVALARECTIMCGKSYLTWPDISSTAWYWMEMGHLTNGGQEGMKVAAAIVGTRNDIRDPKQPQNPGKILSLLLAHRMADATDPRDQLFGLRGLLADAFNEVGIDVDYTMEAADVYRHFAVKMVEKMQTLDLFTTPHVADAETSRLGFLPSWVPDWTQLTQVMSLLDYERKTGGILFKSTLGSKHSLCNDSQGMLFGVEGYCVDIIVDAVYVVLNSPTEDYNGPRETFEFLHRHISIASKQWQAIAKLAGIDGIRNSFRRKSQIDVLCRTLCAGDCGKQWAATRRAYDKTRWNIWIMLQVLKLDKFLSLYVSIPILMLTVLATDSRKPRERVSGVAESPIDAFANHNKSHERHVFRTREGRIGLGPPLAAVGDSIMLCKGSRLPLVLRRSGDNWQLVGDCYVDCMVNGELWDESKCERIWLV